MGYWRSRQARGLGRSRKPLPRSRGYQWQLIRDNTLEPVAYYTAATQRREREGLPCTGVSVDRRQLTQAAEALHSDNIKSYICLCCAQIRTYVRNWECAYDVWDKERCERWESQSKYTYIQKRSVEASLWKLYKEHPDAFVQNFCMATFKGQYVEGRLRSGINPFLNANDFDPDNYEWQRELQLPDDKGSMRIL